MVTGQEENNRMSFFEFLLLITIGGIISVAGPYALLIMIGGLSTIMGGWGVIVGFVLACWVVWAFFTKLLFR